MVQHNFLLIYRSFKRFKTSFFINLIGLSTGLACTLLIYLWVQDELKFDKFHANDSQLYQVMEKDVLANETTVGYRTSGLVAETLKDKYPEIKYAVPVIESSWFPKFIITDADENKLKATGQFVGKDYFRVFSFGLNQGDIGKVLQDKNSIVLSEELARKIFKGVDNVIGKSISLQLAHLKLPVIVTGVFKEVPDNSSENFDFLLAFDSFKDISPAVLNWGNNGTNTYIIVNESADIQLLNSKISGLVRDNVPSTNRNLFLKQYSETYLYGKYENGIRAGGRIEYVRLFSIVALFILLIASINFMNLSTAKASRRIKEVGIKKAIGASRKTLILQYLGESMLMAFISFFIALIMVDLLLPAFNEIAGKQLQLALDATMVIAFLGITIATGLVSGSYPALYLSGFNPATVLKGKVNSTVGELLLRKGLVVFQYVVSVVLMVGVWVVYKQVDYIQSKNLGYSRDNIIYFENEGNIPSSLEPFIEELKKVPGVIMASSMFGNITGGYSTTADVAWQGKGADDRSSFEIIDANYELLEMLDIKMATGREFSREMSADTSKIIFNQAAIELMELNDPIGETVNIWGENLEIIGVTNNFHFQSLHENVKPLFIRLKPNNASIIMAKIKAGNEQETLLRLQEFYKIYNPGYSFDYKFLDQDFQAQYLAETRISSLSQGFAMLAILISSLGLFGLSAFTAERRIKEIGIRKILGSSDGRIVYLLTTEFTKIVSVAIIIALPISYLLIENWLNSFAFRVELSWSYFIGAGFSALIIALLTVSFQAFKASRISAVDSLRSE